MRRKFSLPIHRESWPLAVAAAPAGLAAMMGGGTATALLLALSVIGLSAASWHMAERRRTWEARTDRDLGDVKAKSDAVSRALDRTGDDVKSLRASLTALRQLAERAPQSPPQTQNSGATIPAAAKDPFADQRPLSQRKAAPATPPAAAQKPRPRPAPIAVPPPAITLRATIANDPAEGRQQIEDLVPDYSDTVVSELIDHAITQENIAIFCQPIVRLPQRKPTALEFYGRIRARSGTYLPAKRYLPVARNHRRIGALDTLVLQSCLNEIETALRRGAPPIPCFLNIELGSLRNAAFMGSLLDRLKTNRDLANRLVFEMPQDTYESIPKALLPLLDGLARLGCRFSMDSVRTPKFNARQMKDAWKIDFVKLDAQRLATLGRQPEGLERMQAALDTLRRGGVTLIVERVETETLLREILDFDIDFGQGFLLGKPDHEAAYTGLLKTG